MADGAAQAKDSALATASAELQWRNGWSTAATFEGGYARTGYVRAGMSGRITCEACSPPT